MEEKDNIPRSIPSIPKRGRPLGSVNKSAKFTHYRPKRWHPEFDLIVIESISGLDNESIGRKYGYTKEHVSNILSTPEAQEVRERVRGTINKEFEGTLQEKISSIGKKTIEHIEKFIEDDKGLADSSPFYFIDRALKIGNAIGTLANPDSGRGNTNTIINGNAIVINSEQRDNLAIALERARELDKISTGDNIGNRDLVSDSSELIGLKRVG